MRTTSITVGVPVTDLAAARQWYERILELPAPDIEPMDGVAEYQIGGVWLQLAEDPGGPGGWAFRIGVPDVRAERERLLGLGVEVGPVEEIEGLIAFCDFTDPDGNILSIYTVAH